MTLRCEVLVVGGGVAGVPAAVAAARAGADTLLVEKRDVPGGAGVAGLHRFICGLYPNGHEHSGTLLNDGIVREVCARLRELDPTSRPVRLGKVKVLPYSPTKLQEVLTAMIEGEEHLRVLFDTPAVRFTRDAGRICRMTARGMEVVPCTVVDCSGHGVVIASDPDLHEPAPKNGRQLAGFTIRISGLGEFDDALPIKVPYTVRQGVEAEALPDYLRYTTFVQGALPGEGCCKLSLPAGRPDLGLAQHDAWLLHDYLKEGLPAFKDSRITGMSDEVMEREGARLKGLYTLTDRDVLQGRSFPDAAARGAWPIEVWDPDKGPTYRYLETGVSYDIPLRCLKAVAVENLFCAGRCISVTREGLGSTRVMGVCMALGEAAGREAARIARMTSG